MLLRASVVLLLLPLAALGQAPAEAAGATRAVAADAPAAGASAPAAGEAPPERDRAQPRLLPGNDQVIAAPAPVAVLQGPPVDLRFEDTPVREVVHAILGDLLKVDYMLHPPVDGRVTLVASGPVAPDKAVFLLEAALQASGLVLARDARGVYHVGKPELLKAITPDVRQVRGSEPLPPGSGVIVVPLKYIGAGEMAAILRPLAPPEAILRVDSVRNLLVLAGSRAQAEGWLSLVQTFDVNLLAGMSVGVFPLRYLSVADVEAALALAQQGAAAAAPAPAAAAPSGAATAAGRAGPAFAAERLPLFGAVRVLPVERLNSVIVVSPRAAYLEEARRWIERLDRPGSSANEQRLFVYRVKNGSAQHLGQVLAGIFGSRESAGAAAAAAGGVAPGLASATGATRLGGNAGAGTGATAPTTGTALGLGAARTPQPARGATAGQGSTALPLEGGLRVVADERNNAILVYGTAAQFERIEDALRRLDVPPTQVLIEASIVEVTLTDETSYGLQWAFGDTRAGGGTGTSVLSGVAGGVLGGPLAGFSYTLRNSVGNVRAVLNALAEKSLVRVISSPSMMVLDNHMAQIAVGNQQPIQTSETLSAEGNVRTTSIQYKDTGVSLAVTPSVGAGDMVTMAIDQAVTDVGAIDAATGQRAFLQRQFSSKVAVRSGEAVVLGGLIRENDTGGSSGVPGLHEVPVLGALFGTKTSSKNRTELIVVITPRVARSDADARAISRDLREKLRGLEPPQPLPLQHDPALRAPGDAQR
ncbi:MAG: type II secretion system protein GspD [Rubrivivax sp. SCN 71-131]|nr:MAG: type II secretion system protein GspD [Rubrivivax sp. SCN 71-131]